MTSFDSQSVSLSESIDKLRTYTQINIQASWFSCAENLPIEVATTCDPFNWSSVELNAKGYITWQAGQQVMWLGQRLVIPQDLQGYPLGGLALRLALTWWAESAQVFVNGQLVQEGDLFDSSARVLLSSAVVPGEEITVALRLVSPNHDIGALMRSRCVYEVNSPCLSEAATGNGIDPGFVADELAVLHKYLETFEPEKLDTLAAAIAEIDWDAVSQQDEFARSLITLRQKLQSQIPNPTSNIHILGHAHLDLAWLWTVSETWEVAQRTFESVLTLQQEFPDLTFCHSTPALYAWIEQHRPDLFASIKQQVAAGRWEVVGGMWVEPELNLINGESIVRQVLYAQRYVQEKFGQLTTVAWVPDSFGFCWQLPQILKQGGLEYFVTQKLHWNDTTKFPYGVFWWRSPDGTEIFSLMSPPNTTGVMDTNPITMASYAVDWETQTNLKDAFWLPGVGDHGGGPTRDMLEVAKRWQQSPFFPSLEFTTADAYLQGIKGEGEKGRILHKTFEQTDNSITPSPPHPLTFPVWNDELYLEFHRGCYTTHADQKRWNRHCEGLLYQAELFASLATLTTGSSYPRIQLEDAWKKVLFNQFHDILPGTSIPEVFVEANEAWQQVEQVGLKILDASLKAIASHIALPPPPQPDAQPLIIFNPLNWQRSELVAVSLPDSTEAAWEIYDLSGQKILSQLSNQQGAKDWGLGTREEFSTSVVIGSTQDSSPNPQPLVSSPSETSTLLFLAKDVPGVGYRVFWLCRCDRQVYPTDSREPSDPKSVSITPLFPLIGERGREGEGERLSTEAEKGYTRRIWYEGESSCPSNGKENWVLENELLRVVVDPDTGDLSSVFDKIHQREVLSGPGNQLQAFQDSGQYWDAWNIDPNYAQHPLPPTQLKSIQWLERGPMRTGTPEENLQSSVSTGQSRLRVVRQLGQSQFCQDYVLSADSPILKIVTTVDWQERHVLVKAAFPLNLEANYATYEIPCGAIQRPTRPQTSAEQAKWEVSALRWADLGDETYGVSLLNDCKYGYDAQSSQLRLTLLRSPCWPDPEADRGIHQFTYALYPHSGSWQSASTVRRGYELNLPLIVLNSSSVEAYAHTPLQSIGRLLDFQAENLILTALKQSEDAPNQWIVRCYECHGESAELSLMSDLDLAIAYPVDVLERPIQTSEQLSYGRLFSVSPWKIASFLAMPGTE